MADKNKKDIVDYDKPVVEDEMQRALSFELEHKILWLWYVLDSFVMWATYFIFTYTEAHIPPAGQVLVILYFVVMFFCLSLYNIKAANKGVLNSFSRYQKGMRGGKHLVAALNLLIPTSSVVLAFYTKVEHPAQNYKVFFAVLYIMAAAYEIISGYCVGKNQKIRDSLAADDDNEEE